MAILRFWDLFEVATREFAFPTHDNLQVCDHPIVFSCVFSINLAHMSSESH